MGRLSNGPVLIFLIGRRKNKPQVREYYEDKGILENYLFDSLLKSPNPLVRLFEIKQDNF